MTNHFFSKQHFTNQNKLCFINLKIINAKYSGDSRVSVSFSSKRLDSAADTSSSFQIDLELEATFKTDNVNNNKKYFEFQIDLELEATFKTDHVK